MLRITRIRHLVGTVTLVAIALVGASCGDDDETVASDASGTAASDPARPRVRRPSPLPPHGFGRNGRGVSPRGRDRTGITGDRGRAERVVTVGLHRAGRPARARRSRRSASPSGTATSRSPPGRGPRTSWATPSPRCSSTTDGFEYERIAALEPDLIIGTNAGLTEESYGLLSAIAPTIAHPAGRAAVLLAVGRPGPPDRQRPWS